MSDGPEGPFALAARLGSLAQRIGPGEGSPAATAGRAVARQVLARLTDDELDQLEEAANTPQEAWTDEHRSIVDRVREDCEATLRGDG